ncbi:unnamed protein product [Parajaminaea phylloscopi]
MSSTPARRGPARSSGRLSAVAQPGAEEHDQEPTRGGEEEDEEEDEEEEEEAEDAAEGDEDAEEDDPAERLGEDDYTRLQGAVARHRQVAALAAGVPYVDHMKNKKPPSARTIRSMHKRISKARIESIENVLPPDPEEDGWFRSAASPAEAHAIYTFILHTLKNFTARGHRCASVIESLPQDASFLEMSDQPTSLSQVEERVARSEYKETRAFDVDLCRVFTTFRRGYPLGTPKHGDVCVLQRLYQWMTRSRSTVKHSTLQLVQQNLAAGDAKNFYSTVPFGPGQASRGQGTDLTTRPVIRGKVYFTHALHKGHVFQVGDWIHLMNPSEPSTPTLAQIFKICKRGDEMDQPPLLSCCWYFRPEQTVHAPSRQFVAEEVFKTGLFADHAVDDVLEKAHVLFYTKWNKGRPPRNVWDPKAPLYYCEARYNERNHEFNKIKNWNSCLPEEMRGSEQPLHYFPEPLPQPSRVSSPLLRGVKGPGRLCEESDAARGAASPTPGTEGGIPDPFADGPKKKRRMDEMGSPSGPQAHMSYPMSQPFGPQGTYGMQPGFYPPGPAPGPYGFAPPSNMQSPPPNIPDQHVVQQQHAYGLARHYSQTLPNVVGRGEFNRIQQLFTSPAAMSVDLAALSAGIGNAVDVGTLHKWRAALQVVGPAAVNTPQVKPYKSSSGSKHERSSAHAAKVPTIERSLQAALGGIEAHWKPLPKETVQKFVDEENAAQEHAAIRWFPAPPMPTASRRAKLQPSLDYLYFRAQLAQGMRSHSASGPATSLPDAPPAVPTETALLCDLHAAWEETLRNLDGEQPLSAHQRAPNGANENADEDESDEEVSGKLMDLTRQLAA